MDPGYLAPAKVHKYKNDAYNTLNGPWATMAYNILTGSYVPCCGYLLGFTTHDNPANKEKMVLPKCYCLLTPKHTEIYLSALWKKYAEHDCYSYKITTVFHLIRNFFATISAMW